MLKSRRAAIVPMLAAALASVVLAGYSTYGAGSYGPRGDGSSRERRARSWRKDTPVKEQARRLRVSDVGAHLRTWLADRLRRAEIDWVLILPGDQLWAIEVTVARRPNWRAAYQACVDPQACAPLCSLRWTRVRTHNHQVTMAARQTVAT